MTEPATAAPLTDEQCRALLRDIMVTVRDAAEKIPDEKRRARSLTGLCERNYAMGLADGVEEALRQVAERCRPFVEAEGV